MKDEKLSTEQVEDLKVKIRVEKEVQRIPRLIEEINSGKEISKEDVGFILKSISNKTLPKKFFLDTFQEKNKFWGEHLWYIILEIPTNLDVSVLYEYISRKCEIPVKTKQLIMNLVVAGRLHKQVLFEMVKRYRFEKEAEDQLLDLGYKDIILKYLDIFYPHIKI